MLIFITLTISGSFLPLLLPNQCKDAVRLGVRLTADYLECYTT